MVTDATVFVVDDDGNVRRSLVRMLRASDFETVEFASGSEFLAGYHGGQPGCILMDIIMPDVNGLDVLDELTELPQANPIIMMTGQANVPMATRALESGAFAFIEKPFRREELIRRIQTAMEHDVKTRQHQDRRSELLRRFRPLSSREWEVLDLVVEGKLTKQIAYQLGISQRTVETHRCNIMTKVGADCLAQLVALTVEVRTAQRRARTRAGSPKRPWRMTSQPTPSTFAVVSRELN